MTSERRPVIAMVAIGVLFCVMAIAAVWLIISQPAPADGFTGHASVNQFYFSGDGCAASIILPDGAEEVINIGRRDICESMPKGSVINVKSGRYMP